MPIISNINSIIFDLGGVIINLSPGKTYQAFSEISGLPITEVEEMARSKQEFSLYETGHLSDEDFRSFLRISLAINVTDNILDQAWNAMLLDIPPQRLQTLLRLKTNYKTFLLSNTNAIHLKAFNKILREVSGSENFEQYFEKDYYSHEMGLRKPDPTIFEYVVREQRLNPAETIFLDDSSINLTGAAQAGLHIHHVTNADELFKELDKY
ncbi:HAD family phosphatase [Chryseotalea sanaruensis]|uniref:HAD family phosphatase n=1 Tax=Chryseotalea sanaruensis TaxID=2482724 RepID=A0A401UDJ4_9BACT|nr:HAD family phosphatase [Chryseotalea sanaruensis]GCC52966.1 HAD family phosphatase [Chryseotalea sanaruensis]